MKKIMAFLLTLCILGVTAAIGISAAAPMVRISSCEASAGDTVKLTVSIDNFGDVTDPDGVSAAKPIDTLFSAIQLKIYYDDSKFEVSEYRAADEKGGKTSPQKLGSDFAADIVKRSDAKGSYIYLSVMCVSGNGIILASTSDVAELNLKVKENASDGGYDFIPSAISLVTGIQGQPKNVASQFALSKGTVTVKGSAAPTSDLPSGDTTSDITSGNSDSDITSHDDPDSSILDNGSTGTSRTDSGNASNGNFTSRTDDTHNGKNPITGDTGVAVAALLLLASAAMVLVSKKPKPNM